MLFIQPIDIQRPVSLPNALCSLEYEIALAGDAEKRSGSYYRKLRGQLMSDLLSGRQRVPA